MDGESEKGATREGAKCKSVYHHGKQIRKRKN